MTIQLRPDYQLPLANAVRAAYRESFKAPLVVLPTGGGKTTIFAYVATGSANKGKTVFLLAHRAELVKQISMTLARFGTIHRVVAPPAIVRQAKVAHFKELGRSFVAADVNVYVCSVQTLVQRIAPSAKGGIVAKPDVIIIDEAHHLTTTSTWGKVVAAYPEALLLLVTATPCRLDGKGLGLDAGGVADVMVEGPSMGWLIDQGYLSSYGLLAPPTPIDMTGVRTSKGDYEKGGLRKALDKPTITGDVVKHYRANASGRRAIVFCVSVEHAEHVTAQFNDSGVASCVLDGSLDPNERDRRIAAFEAGEIMVMTSCEVVSEGFDLPAIEVAILLRPTKSLSLFLQQVGRALRAVYSPGFDLSTRAGRLAAIAAGPKRAALIIDHVGNIGRMQNGKFIINHGLPDQDRVWTLEGPKKKARTGGGGDGEDVLIQTCPKCFSIHRPAPICPTCGFVYPGGGRQMQVDDGTLVEVSTQEREDQLAAAAAAKLAAAADQEKLREKYRRKREEADCHTLDDLVALAERRGYAFPEQWARHRFGARQRKLNPSRTVDVFG